MLYNYASQQHQDGEKFHAHVEDYAWSQYQGLRVQTSKEIKRKSDIAFTNMVVSPCTFTEATDPVVIVTISEAKIAENITAVSVMLRILSIFSWFVPTCLLLQVLIHEFQCTNDAQEVATDQIYLCQSKAFIFRMK